MATGASVIAITTEVSIKAMASAVATMVAQERALYFLAVGRKLALTATFALELRPVSDVSRAI